LLPYYLGLRALVEYKLSFTQPLDFEIPSDIDFFQNYLLFLREMRLDDT
jgi:hypothetical protein